MLKNKSPPCLNYHRPVALTAVVMKYFDRLMKTLSAHPSQIPLTPFNLPADGTNRSREDASQTCTCTTLEDARIDFRSAFNTIQHHTP